MKATVITVYDNDGNEIKNVSTEIVLNGETYVKREMDKQTTPDYSHLVGMWCKFIGYEGVSFSTNKWYKCEKLDVDGAPFFIANNNNLVAFSLKGTANMFDLSNPALDTPTKPIWETCRELMWRYDSDTRIVTNYSTGTMNQDASLYRLNKHLNALAYLSEVARRCNGDRVVDWGNEDEKKYYVRRYKNILETGWSEVYHKEITFLDEAARDHSFEVDRHIWKDYYGLPNE